MAKAESTVTIAGSVDIEGDTEGRRPQRRSALAVAGIIGPIWFTTLVVMQGLLLPDYSHVRLPISALAAWPTGWIQNVNFYVAGVLTMAFAVALHHGVQPTRRGGAGVASLGRTSFGAPATHPITTGSISRCEPTMAFPFTIGASSRPVRVSISSGFSSSTR